jgi:hypothetical protein
MVGSSSHAVGWARVCVTTIKRHDAWHSPDGIARNHLKNVFWPNIFVGAAFQILDIQQYASGLKLGPAAILNQNPIFEMVSKCVIQ